MGVNQLNIFQFQLELRVGQFSQIVNTLQRHCVWSIVVRCDTAFERQVTQIHAERCHAAVQRKTDDRRMTGVEWPTLGKHPFQAEGSTTIEDRCRYPRLWFSRCCVSSVRTNDVSHRYKSNTPLVSLYKRSFHSLRPSSFSFSVYPWRFRLESGSKHSTSLLIVGWKETSVGEAKGEWTSLPHCIWSPRIARRFSRDNPLSCPMDSFRTRLERVSRRETWPMPVAELEPAGFRSKTPIDSDQLQCQTLETNPNQPTI